MIVVVGLSHRTAPVAVREKIALPKADIARVLGQLVERPELGEAMLISTCNRVELVAAGRSGPQSDTAEVGRAALDGLSRLAPGVREHLYVYEGSEAVSHLFRVASSLDSIVLGEPQILGQLKDAFETAKKAGTVGGCLHRTVPRALRAAKRVRTETQLGVGQISVPSVSVDLARQIFGELRGRTVVLIGSGEMAETVAKLLHHAGTRLLVVGRNEARVGVLAAAVGGEARGWAELPETLIDADVVITSTSAPGFVVDYETIAKLRRKRRGRNLFFVDLAVPRDVDPKVETLGEVFLYNIDDFERVVSESRQSRQREAEAAERIVREETAGWQRWAEVAQVTPVVVALRSRLERFLHAELERSLRTKLKHLGEPERAALEAMLEAALNKMLHAPTTHLRQVVSDEDYESPRVEQLVVALTELFELDAEPASLQSVPSTRPASPESTAEADAPAPSAEDEARRATGTNGK